MPQNPPTSPDGLWTWDGLKWIPSIANPQYAEWLAAQPAPVLSSDGEQVYDGGQWVEWSSWERVQTNQINAEAVSPPPHTSPLPKPIAVLPASVSPSFEPSPKFDALRVTRLLIAAAFLVFAIMIVSDGRSTADSLAASASAANETAESAPQQTVVYTRATLKGVLEGDRRLAQIEALLALGIATGIVLIPRSRAS